MSVTELPAWRALAEHRLEMENIHMRELFASDPERFDRFRSGFGICSSTTPRTALQTRPCLCYSTLPNRPALQRQ